MNQRIQKIISAAGIASLREAERLIKEGRVTVNGRTASLGDNADGQSDVIFLDGKRVVPLKDKIYIMLNKPRGYVTTLRDERGRRCVADLVRDVGTRLYPIGRLDLNSEGLLLMTNDGDAANALMHPSHGIIKTYRVTVSGENVPGGIQRLKQEFELDGKTILAASVKTCGQTDGRAVIEIGIAQGLNRQIRRMCDLAGLKVHRLLRISEGELRLGSLSSGEWRYLTEKETEYIRNMIE